MQQEARELHRAVVECEQQLKQLLRAKADPNELDALRADIRGKYERIIESDPYFAAAKDVEQALWKTCFYKRIEEFRKRIRKYAQAVAAVGCGGGSGAGGNDRGNGAGAGGVEKEDASRARDHLHKVCQAFAQFLNDATVFYTGLLRRLEARHAQLLQLADPSSVLAAASGGAPAAMAAAAAAAGSMPGGPEQQQRQVEALALLPCLAQSVHRCLIFLGDLARYRELHSESQQKDKDWGEAERRYHEALAVVPGSGNPHNQLAVLATYADAECVAVYRYCRSLMVESPFMTARENLSLLFDKNRHKVDEDGGGWWPADDGPSPPAGGAPAGGTLGVATAGGGGVAGAAAAGAGAGAAKGKVKSTGGRGNTGALLKSFLRRFVRLHGILFSGLPEEVKEFAPIHDGAVHDFRTLLSNSAFGDALLLKMVVICIFSVTNAAAPGEISAPTARDMDGTGRGTVLANALALAFGVAAQIGRHVRTQEPTTPPAPHVGPHSGVGAGFAGGGGFGGGGFGGGGSAGAVGGGGGVGGASGGGGMSGGTSMVREARASSGIGGGPYAGSSVATAATGPGGGGGGGGGKVGHQPQPRPLGSRLLGPVVLFCDWLLAHNSFLRQRDPAGGDAGRGGGDADGGLGAPSRDSAARETLARADFVDMLCRLCNAMPDPPDGGGSLVDSDMAPLDALGRRRALREHLELRGFLPLAHVYEGRFVFDGPYADGGPDDRAGAVRIRGLKAFARALADPADARLHGPAGPLVAVDGIGVLYPAGAAPLRHSAGSGARPPTPQPPQPPLPPPLPTPAPQQQNQPVAATATVGMLRSPPPGYSGHLSPGAAGVAAGGVKVAAEQRVTTVMLGAPPGLSASPYGGGSGSGGIGLTGQAPVSGTFGPGGVHPLPTRQGNASSLMSSPVRCDDGGGVGVSVPPSRMHSQGPHGFGLGSGGVGIGGGGGMRGPEEDDDVVMIVPTFSRRAAAEAPSGKGAGAGSPLSFYGGGGSGGGGGSAAGSWRGAGGIGGGGNAGGGGRVGGGDLTRTAAGTPLAGHSGGPASPGATDDPSVLAGAAAAAGGLKVGGDEGTDQYIMMFGMHQWGRVGGFGGAALAAATDDSGLGGGRAGNCGSGGGGGGSGGAGSGADIGFSAKGGPADGMDVGGVYALFHNRPQQMRLVPPSPPPGLSFMAPAPCDASGRYGGTHGYVGGGHSPTVVGDGMDVVGDSAAASGGGAASDDGVVAAPPWVMGSRSYGTGREFH